MATEVRMSGIGKKLTMTCELGDLSLADRVTLLRHLLLDFGILDKLDLAAQEAINRSVRARAEQEGVRL